jgi:hypothetical protein
MCPTIRRAIHIDDLIRVRHDVPQVGVRSGELGVVQSRWFAPDQAFEIEFHAGGLGLPLRVILYEDDIEPADDAEPGDDAPPARG